MATTYKSDAQLVTVRQLAQMDRYRLVFTENRIRSLIAAGSPRINGFGQIAPPNGILESAVIRVGRRILIDPELFEAWLRSNKTHTLPFV